MRKHVLLALVLSPTLTGCSKSIVGTADQMCRTWLPVYVSKRDVLTTETKQDIAGNNASREAWCGKPSKREAPQQVAQNG